jgi:hypothetical protein
MKPPSRAAFLERLTSLTRRLGGPAVDGVPDPDGAEPRERTAGEEDHPPAAKTAQGRRAMRFLAPSIEDIQIWGRCFGLYPGATATGSSERNLHPRADGGLTAAIPLQDASRVERLCQTIGLDLAGLESDTRQLPAFKLGLTGYKFETSFRGAVKWFTNWNLQSLEDDRVFRLISSETYLGSSITSSIEEAGHLVDSVIACESPFVPRHQVFALDGVAI